jgi:surface protein
MSIRTVQSSAMLSRHSAFATRNNGGSVTDTTQPWIRNRHWLTMPEMTETDQAFYGLVAVFLDSSFLALTAAGAYTIDWGDGVVENIATGVQSNHLYDYTAASLVGTEKPVSFVSATSTVSRTAHGYTNGELVKFYNIQTTTGISEGVGYYVVSATADTFQVSLTVGGAAISLTSDGSAALLPYRQAIVTVTPQAGQQLTALSLNVKHTQANLQTYETGWLDILCGSPNFSATGLVIGQTSTTETVRKRMLERVRIKNCGNTTSFAYRFYNLVELRSVEILNCSAVTDMNNMFQNCYSLQTVPLFNTAAVTNMTGMFYGCYSLQTVPLFSTAAVTAMNQMFYICYSLQTVPLFNTAAVTNMSGMFYNCYSLQTVPLFNTAAVTSMIQMFYGCYSLQTVPLFSTAAVTSMLSMFYNCYSLQTVPLFNTVAVTTMSQMFYNCYSLQTVPLFNTVAVTTMSSMFYNCYSLQTVPLFNTVAVTTMSQMFYGCYSLQTVPALVTTAVTSSSSFSSMFSSCENLSRIKAKNFRFTFSVASCKLSATALDEIYTNLPTVTGQTITVTGNWGTATDDPTIATAKGWTVTG